MNDYLKLAFIFFSAMLAVIYLFPLGPSSGVLPVGDDRLPWLSFMVLGSLGISCMIEYLKEVTNDKHSFTIR